MAWRTDDANQVENCSLPTGTYDTTEDSLWLMSVAEIYTLVGGGTIANSTIDGNWSTCYDNLFWNNQAYLLRSPGTFSSRYVFYVEFNGYVVDDNAFYTYAIRPAFNLEF